MPTVEQRFLSFVRFTSDGCCEWTGCRRKGYGRFWPERKTPVSAHRFSWELFKGPLLKGMKVLHTCDNPPCVNPSHLFTGTQLDNVWDCTQKGRRRYVGREPRSNWVQIAEAPGLLREVAAQFGVSEALVCMYRKRRVEVFLPTVS